MGGFITENGTFFDRVWMKGLDEDFLKEVESHVVRAGRSLNFADDAVFDNILTHMCWYTDHIFGLEAIHRCFKLVNLRYHTWKGIMEHEGVHYDSTKMSATATNWTWIELCETYELASAYHKVGIDRMWHELNAIFGPDEARNPELKSRLPPKPLRAFELICANGKRLPTVDEILAEYLEDEKLALEEKERRNRKKRGIVELIDPADYMSSTKHSGIELAPSKEVIVIISPEMISNRIQLWEYRASKSQTSSAFLVPRI